MSLNNVPLPGQSLAITRDPINNNFAVINTAFSVDHVSFNTANQGIHNQVTMPSLPAAPATAAAQLALFTQVSALTGISEMAFRRESNGAVIEMTAADGVAGWSRFPSGILMKWGQSNANGLATITFPVGPAIPAFTVIFSIQITTFYPNVADGNGFVRLNSFAAPWTQFQVYGSQRTAVVNQNVGFQYLAIGA